MHPGNNIETRLQGMDLFLLWYQALQDNAGEHVRLIYATLIPGINKSVKSEDGRNHTFSTLINDNTGKFLVRQFKCMVSCVRSFRSTLGP